MKLCLHDAKGDYVELTFTKPMNYIISKKGLLETWVWCQYDTLIFEKYPSIPIPIFTDWFVPEIAESLSEVGVLQEMSPVPD